MLGMCHTLMVLSEEPEKRNSLQLKRNIASVVGKGNFWGKKKKVE